MTLAMALRAAPAPIVASTAVLGRPAGIESLRMELTAAGQEMRAAGMEIAALLASRNDLAISQEAARLVARGDGYIRRGTR